MQVNNQDSIVLFIPESKTEREWLQDNCQAEAWQFLGSGLAVDHRYADDIIEGLKEDGFEVSQ